MIFNAAPPWKREGFSETDSTQYCNSKKHWNQEEAQLLTTPPMHQIQPIGSIKRLFKKYRCEHKKHKLKTSKQEASRRMKKEETEKQEKSYTTVKSVVLYFAFMNIVLEIQLNHSSLKILN